MTNEEKAKEIGQKWYYDNTDSNGAAYRAALQMAKWKDSQPQIIEIFGKRVKVVEDETNTIAACYDCVFDNFCRYKIGRGILCEDAKHSVKLASITGVPGNILKNITKFNIATRLRASEATLSARDKRPCASLPRIAPRSLGLSRPHHLFNWFYPFAGGFLTEIVFF